MKTSMTVRFGVAALLISAGCALLLAGIYAGILFAAAVVFFMPRSELTQPIPRHEIWFIVGGLCALVAAIVAARYLLPGSASDIVQRVTCHPAFVVPLWLLMLWGLRRHWQRQKAGVDA